MKIFKQNRRLLLYTAIVLVFILIYKLNVLYPLIYDDFTYSFIYGQGSIRVNSFYDIFISQYNHYFLWGGRSVVHFIDQALLMMDFSWICIFNTLAYIVLVYIIYIIANKNNVVNPILFFLFNIVIWFAQPAFCATVLWKTGAANYLWGTLIVLLFMYSYSKEIKSGLIKSSVFFVLGIIAGWTNENTAIGLITYLLLLLIIRRRENKIIPRWMITGLLGVAVGAVFMIAAPGNFIRSEGISHSLTQMGVSRYEFILLNMNKMLTYLLHYIIPLIVGYVLLLILYYKYPKIDGNKKVIIQSSLLFNISGLATFFVMIASPQFPERALFSTIIFMILSLGIVYANTDLKNIYIKWFNIIGCIILLLLFSIDYYWKFNTLFGVSSIWKEREIFVEEQKNKGNLDIVFLNKFQVHSKYYIWDMNDDARSIENTLYARFHGINSVRVISPVEEKLNK